MIGSSFVLQLRTLTRCTSDGSSLRMPSIFSRTSARIMSTFWPQSRPMPHPGAIVSRDRDCSRCTFGSVLSASSTGLAIDSSTCPGVEFGYGT